MQVAMIIEARQIIRVNQFTSATKLARIIKADRYLLGKERKILNRQLFWHHGVAGIAEDQCSMFLVLRIHRKDPHGIKIGKLLLDSRAIGRLQDGRLSHDRGMFNQ